MKEKGKETREGVRDDPKERDVFVCVCSFHVLRSGLCPGDVFFFEFGGLTPKREGERDRDRI